MDGSDTTARVLGGAGFAAGLAALVVAVVRRRRPEAPAPVLDGEHKETARL